MSEEEEEIDLSWVSFLDEEPRNDPVCCNELCNSVAPWTAVLLFPCEHFPKRQALCEKHKGYMEYLFSEEYYKEVQCRECRKTVDLDYIEPNKFS